MARIAEQLTAAADLDQHPLQDPRRASSITGLPDLMTTGPGRSSSSPAAPAAPSSRAACSTSSATTSSSSPTRRRHRDLRRPRLPRPGPRAPSGSPSASTSAAGASTATPSPSWTRCASSARRRLVQPRRPRPRHRPATARQLLAEGATLDRGASRRSPRRSASPRACCRCATSRCAPGCWPAARWRGLPGVPDPRARAQGPVDGVELRRDRRGARPPPRCSTRSPPPRAIVIGPSNPVISIGPILAVPGDARGAAATARARRRGLPDRRRRGAQGPDRARSWRAPACPLDAAGIARAYAGPARRAGRRRGRPRRRRAPRWPRRHADGGRRRAARARRRRRALDLSPTTFSRHDEGTSSRRPPGQALRRRQAAARRRRPARGDRGRSPRRCSPTCSRRCAARSSDRRRRRRHRASPARRRSPAPTAPQVDPRRPRTAATARPPRAASPGRSSDGALRVLLLPGDCPPLDAARARRAGAPARRRRPTSSIVPDRHGTGTNALRAHARPTRSTPSFGPGSRARHERAGAATPASHVARRGDRARSCSTSTPPTTSTRSPTRARGRAAPQRRVAHPRRCSAACSGDDARCARLAARTGLPEVAPGDDLAALIAAAAERAAARPATCSSSRTRSSPRPRARSRTLADVIPATARARFGAPSTARTRGQVQVVLDETAEVLRAERGVLICRTHHGFVCANAGVDTSNAARGRGSSLLPRDPDATARALRAALPGPRPAVVITDSLRPRLAPRPVRRRDRRRRARAARRLARAPRRRAAASCTRRGSRSPTRPRPPPTSSRDKDAREPAVLVRGLDALRHAPTTAPARRRCCARATRTSSPEADRASQAAAAVGLRRPRVQTRAPRTPRPANAADHDGCAGRRPRRHDLAHRRRRLHADRRLLGTRAGGARRRSRSRRSRRAWRRPPA